MLNRYPSWKYALLTVVLLVGLIYSIPNLFGEDPAIQVLPGAGHSFADKVEDQISNALKTNDIAYKSMKREGNALLIRFADTSLQIQAKEAIHTSLGENYIVALNLAPRTPQWLEMLGAKPMKLGLDLRGGVHFLMEVDTDTAITRRMEGVMGDMRTDFRQENIRYRGINRPKADEIVIGFDDESLMDKALTHLQKQSNDFACVAKTEAERNFILCTMRPSTVQGIRTETVEQTITTLRNRVNELGVAEAVVQRQGLNHIVVELPGIQDTARAKDILGKTATLEFHLYAKEEAAKTQPGKLAPAGTKWYLNEEGVPMLFKKRVILTGESITGASVGADDRTGRPAVHVRVGGPGLSLFKKATLENVGNLMGVVYIETKTQQETVNGQVVKTNRTVENLISAATIQSALGSQFQVTGLSLAQAQDLALLLRAGAMPTSTSIVEERTVGPSLGAENIRLGIMSIVIGMGLVVVVMIMYYSVFGFIANLALTINVVLLIAILSMIGATLTLPGMAGIVLTVGMAVDANVLIFERIREELRNGMSAQAAIHSGFERALSTIIDANLTTLIVGIILFCVGTGPVKGFAVTLCFGILTSMITAITMTRAMVNIAYGGRDVKHLRVGI